MTDYQRDRQSYVSRAGGDEGGQCCDARTRDVRKAGEEEDWKKKTIDRGGWKRLSDEAVKSCVHHLTPFQKEKVEDRE